jgi:hypothetical protein
LLMRFTIMSCRETRRKHDRIECKTQKWPPWNQINFKSNSTSTKQLRESRMFAWACAAFLFQLLAVSRLDEMSKRNARKSRLNLCEAVVFLLAPWAPRLTIVMAPWAPAAAAFHALFCHVFGSLRRLRWRDKSEYTALRFYWHRHLKPPPWNAKFELRK